MAYVAVKGGERAIDAAHAWRAEARRGDPAVPALAVAQIENQLGRAVDRVMAEGSLLRSGPCGAGDQAGAGRPDRGGLPAARLSHHAAALRRDPCRWTPARCAIRRRISAIFKDVPGGQVLGPTYDYTHRLLDFALLAERAPDSAPLAEARRRGRCRGWPTSVGRGGA